jgi:dipeptidyl aminopeptidase/acylaminoacyl peptidase
MKLARWGFLLWAVLSLVCFGWAQAKPKLTLDEFFNSVYIADVKLSPAGEALVVNTQRGDWVQERFRSDLWLIRGDAPAALLTSAGQDSHPVWSPDGRWIAFLSERQLPWTKTSPASGEEKPETVTHLYVIPLTGGEAFPVTRGEESVHSFAWSRDSKSLYFSTREPWSKAKKDAYKKQWKDVIQYREADRGDVIARIAIADAIARAEAITPDTEAAEEEKKSEKSPPSAGKTDENKDKETAETPGTVILAHVPLLVKEISMSHSGQRLAFLTLPPHRRNERTEDQEVFVLNSSGGQPKQLTHNQALESDLLWSADDKQILFGNRTDGIEGKYQDVQGRIYSVEADTGKTQRFVADYGGNIGKFDLIQSGTLVSLGQLGVETQLYSAGSGGKFLKANGWPGTYHAFSVGERSPKVAFVYSAWGKPGEVYLADSLENLSKARPVTSFNKLFLERDLPQGRAYQWKSDDGVSVEGVLLYPPGKFGAKNLPMFTLIHGGPEDADGNSFGADWYDWAVLAATRGWLVFRPNYRGSTGYGDQFELGIVPNIVSKPGRDILRGVDALVKEGVADPEKLTIGGYSYGGYMTNWLLTQTPRFKAAVTGAGAVEHIANWGNDDLTFDDAWYLGGTPWEAAKTYNDEAAIFQITKVKTPTHIVGGAVDVRVYIGEQYLLERALAHLNIPHTLLVFPGEGHGLDENPWHGKIKVREELNWLQKYCPPEGAAKVAD